MAVFRLDLLLSFSYRLAKHLTSPGWLITFNCVEVLRSSFGYISIVLESGGSAKQVDERGLGILPRFIQYGIKVCSPPLHITAICIDMLYNLFL